ncbi:hypothetical protein KEJ15_09105 [Candidatus Bathyarchaeota archaeon]|nr:hypothetical protein [Candidatus Bathyarchaeota archaeon]
MQLSNKSQNEKLFEALAQQWPLLAGGAAGLVSGVVLLFDDVRDFGDLSRPHHYMWGILLIIGGAIAFAIGFANLILKLCS